MKARRSLSPIVSIASVLIAVTATNGQPPDSCLVVPDSSMSLSFATVKDSVLVDTCNHALPIEKLLYSRKWFGAYVRQMLFDSTAAPDSMALQSTDVREDYRAIREALMAIVAELGQVYFQRAYPSVRDSSFMGSHIFNVWFERLVNADSAIARLEAAVPDMIMTFGGVDGTPALIEPGVSQRERTIRVSFDALSQAMYLRGLRCSTRACEVQIELFDMRGRRVGQWQCFTSSSGENTLQVPLIDIPSGTYLVRVAGTTLPVCISKGK